MNPKFFVAHDGEDFWEEASAHVMRNYKIDKDVTVVINGDRASWTRKGLEYFPKAMYQVDRFHLKRELRTLFGKHSSAWRGCMKSWKCQSLREPGFWPA
ncbi:MAG: UPF0236 family protein [Peptococcaceae bacterium MAG4]|nr:UPF0236 family protein [Peptococcaceae bacterium MAG4]